MLVKLVYLSHFCKDSNLLTKIKLFIHYSLPVCQEMCNIADMKILLIEDDDDLREIIVRSLEKERYVVEAASFLADAREKAFVYQYDCILLDIMLPDGSGLDLLRELYEKGKRENVIIISARDSITDKVEGLDLGADDYLTKPFHLAELHARIKSLLRRNQRGGEQQISLGNVTILPDKYEVFVGDTIDKTTLAEAVWGDHIDQSDNFDFVYAQMKNLRKQLVSAGASIEIKTVYGFGYKLTVS